MTERNKQFRKVGYRIVYKTNTLIIFDEEKVKKSKINTKNFSKIKYGKLKNPNRPYGDTWVMPFIAGNSPERTGYPTQKPLALLERIIKASSNKGDIVLDPFCGCATTCVAAEKLNRQWLGIDVSHKAFDLVKKRLEKEVQGEKENGERNLLDYEKEVHFTTTAPKRTDQGKDNLVKKYVYIISNPRYEGEYKVGIAKDYKARLNSYQTSDPDRGYQLAYSIHTPLFREIEKYIHAKFENKHEWVSGKLENIIAAIENYKQ